MINKILNQKAIARDEGNPVYSGIITSIIRNLSLLTKTKKVSDVQGIKSLSDEQCTKVLNDMIDTKQKELQTLKLKEDKIVSITNDETDIKRLESDKSLVMTEIEIFSSFLDVQMSESELKELITKLRYDGIDEVLYDNKKKILKYLRENYTGKYDFNTAENIINSIM